MTKPPLEIECASYNDRKVTKTKFIFLLNCIIGIAEFTSGSSLSLKLVVEAFFTKTRSYIIATFKENSGKVLYNYQISTLIN